MRPGERLILRDAARYREGASGESLAAPLLRIRLPLQQQILQMRDQRQIRRRHRIVAQLVHAYPGELLALARDRLAFPAPADIERHQEMKTLIGVAGEGERRKARLLDGDAEFLMQLADQR